jgi:hypothetical protein
LASYYSPQPRAATFFDAQDIDAALRRTVAQTIKAWLLSL